MLRLWRDAVAEVEGADARLQEASDIFNRYLSSERLRLKRHGLRHVSRAIRMRFFADSGVAPQERHGDASPHVR